MPMAPWDAGLWRIIKTYPRLKPSGKVGQAPSHVKGSTAVGAGMGRCTQSGSCHLSSTGSLASAALKGTSQQQLLMRG